MGIREPGRIAKALAALDAALERWLWRPVGRVIFAAGFGLTGAAVGAIVAVLMQLVLEALDIMPTSYETSVDWPVIFVSIIDAAAGFVLGWRESGNYS